MEVKREISLRRLLSFSEEEKCCCLLVRAYLSVCMEWAKAFFIACSLLWIQSRLLLLSFSCRLAKNLALRGMGHHAVICSFFFSQILRWFLCFLVSLFCLWMCECVCRKRILGLDIFTGSETFTTYTIQCRQLQDSIALTCVSCNRNFAWFASRAIICIR